VITREEMATMRPWEVEEELEKYQQQLAEARAALAEVEEYLDDFCGHEWMAKHAAALKAAREAKA